ncbi:MAG TPA: hypothetical protein VII22_14145 [Streptosporangiaceae bacterium]
MHGVALIVVTLITSARGAWWWTLATLIVISGYVGQLVLNRRASRSKPS